MTDVARNVLGTELVACSYDPLTGYFRDGCCHTDMHDLGSHVVCAIVTDEFLEFSRSRGNDLSTPRPEYRFVLMCAALERGACGGRRACRGAGEHARTRVGICDARAVTGIRLHRLALGERLVFD